LSPMASPIVKEPPRRKAPSTHRPVSRARLTTRPAPDSEPQTRGTGNLLKRVVLAAATTLVSLNL
jgi:hypothetical protein